MADELRFAPEDDWTWAAEVQLPAWRGFQARRGDYGAKSADAPSDGAVRILVSREGGPDDAPAADALAGAAWLAAHEAEVAQALLAGLLARYPEMRSRYGYVGEERKRVMPDLAGPDGFKTLIGLSAINLHAVRRDGLPYAGFEFGCAWDDEHGLGVLMHGPRVVAVGGADTAILAWIAEQDAERAP